METFFESWLGAHWGFIAASYGVTTLVILALIGWVLIDVTARKRELADLEARGVRRRSARAAATLQPVEGQRPSETVSVE